MAMKPWYKIVEPREDLRKGRPLDASEFAVHLDKVREGTAPDDYREQKLEAAVTTDICGKKDSHAIRLDAEAVDTIKKARLHRKVATVVFFESNGGQAQEGEATAPEIRLGVCPSNSP